MKDVTNDLEQWLESMEVGGALFATRLDRPFPVRAVSHRFLVLAGLPGLEPAASAGVRRAGQLPGIDERCRLLAGAALYADLHRAVCAGGVHRRVGAGAVPQSEVPRHVDRARLDFLAGGGVVGGRFAHLEVDFNPSYGLVNFALGAFGIEGPAWLFEPQTAVYAMVITSVWKDVGYIALLYLGGLQNISESYYEAARIDGANRCPYIWQEAQHTAATGEPLMRPLKLWHPQVSDYAYAFGRDLLVYPVVEPGVDSADCYLPPGEWRDFWTGEVMPGGQVYRVNSPLGYVPVFRKHSANKPG